MLNKHTLVLIFCALVASCSEYQGPRPVNVQAPDGINIAATVHSHGNPTLVLVHGWMCDQTYWDNQVPALSEHFGVVSVDVAGHGLSGLDRNEWTTASLGADVAAVVRHLKLDHAVVVGHSLGGRVALEAARLLPGTVVGVIGVDTLQDAEETIDPAEVEALIGALEQDFATTCDSFVRSMFVEGSADELMDPIAADMCGGPGEIGVALIRDYVNYDLAAGLRSADVPIRTINVDKWPTNTETNRKYADFDAVILHGYGHFLMQEAPDELNRALIETVNAMPWALPEPR